MKIESKSAPTVASSLNQPSSSSRDRAIASFMGAQPVPNPTSVSPEELGAVQAPKEAEEPKSGQTTDIEATSGDSQAKPDSENKNDKQESSEENQALSKQYALLAKKEKALRLQAQQEKQALKAERDAIEAEKAAIRAKEQEYQTNYISKSKLSEDTMTALLEAGITYEQITQMALNQAQAPTDPHVKLAIQKLETQVKAQAEAQEKAQKLYQEEQSRQYQQALRQIHSEAQTLVNSDPDTYEAIHKSGSVKEVANLIEKTFEQDGIILSVEEAAQLVEDHLVEKYAKVAEMKKIQNRLKPKAEPSKQDNQKSSDNNQQPQIKTLTNNVGVSKPLGARERAILAFKGQLGK